MDAADAALADAATFSANVVLPEGLGVIRFDGIPVADTAVALKQLLAEHPCTCPYTSYRLELEWPIPGGSLDRESEIAGLVAEDAEEGPLRVDVGRVVEAGPAGSLKRVIAVTEALPDLSPFVPLLQQTKASGKDGAPAVSIRLLLEPYDVRRARQHVRRLREVLVKPPVAPVVLPAPIGGGDEDADAGSAGRGRRAGDATADGTGSTGGADDVEAEATAVADAALAASSAPGSVTNPVSPAPLGGTSGDMLNLLLDDSGSGVGGANGAKLLAAAEAQRVRIAAAQRRVASLPIPVPASLGSLFPIPLGLNAMEELMMGATASASATAAAAAGAGANGGAGAPGSSGAGAGAGLDDGMDAESPASSAAAASASATLSLLDDAVAIVSAAAAPASGSAPASSGSASASAAAGASRKDREREREAAALGAVAAFQAALLRALPVPPFMRTGQPNAPAPQAAAAAGSAPGGLTVLQTAALCAGPVATRQAVSTVLGSMGLSLTGASTGTGTGTLAGSAPASGGATASGSAAGGKGKSGASSSGAGASAAGSSSSSSSAPAAGSSAGIPGVVGGPLPACLSSITLSGWNPPPAPRRMAGDLLYLRVETLEGHTLSVTATSTGFHVNKCVDPSSACPGGLFDPSPAAPSYYSRTLWTLLSRASAGFRRNYQNLLAAAAANVNAVIGQAASTWDAAFSLSVAPVYNYGAAGIAGSAAAIGSTGSGSGGLIYGSSGNPISAVAAAAAAAASQSLQLGLPAGSEATMTVQQAAAAAAAAVAAAAASPPASSLAAAAAAAGLPPPHVASPPASATATDTSAGSSALTTPASTFGIAAPPAGSFAFARSPWLVPESFLPATPGAPGGPGSAASASADGSAPASSGYLHTFDPMRAEDDALCSFGMSDRGALRDFNEEWQACRDLPSRTEQERIVRARATAKILADFVDAATQGAMAIVGGHVSPLNAAEDSRSHVWVFNDIFFSSASPAAAKEEERAVKRRAGTGAGAGASSPSASVTAVGAFEDLASLAAPHQDLAGMLALNKADVPGLHTLATAVVTFAGHTFTAQSIIPGILQAEGASRLVYGSVDNGASIACDKEMLRRLREAAPALQIAERVFTPFGAAAAGGAGDGGAVAADGSAIADAGEASAKGKDSDSSPASPAAPALAVSPSAVLSVVTGVGSKGCADTKPAPLVGPVECKGIQGSDGRFYLLDFVRSTPKDALAYDGLWRAARAYDRASRAAAEAAAAPGASAAAIAAAAALPPVGPGLSLGEVLDAVHDGRVSLAYLGGSAAAAVAGTGLDVAANEAGEIAAAADEGGSGSGSNSDIYAPEHAALFSLVHESARVSLLRPELVRLFTQHQRATKAAAAAAAAERKGAATDKAGVDKGADKAEDADKGKDKHKAEEKKDGADAPASADAAAAAVSSAGADAESAETHKTEDEAEAEVPRFNVNALTRFMRCLPAAERQSDDDAIRGLSRYLREACLPFVFARLRAPNAPTDGEETTRLLHRMGVNVRYMGRLARMARETEAPHAASTPPYVLEQLECEMVARVARRHLDSLLRDNASCKAAPAVAVAAFLNALLGAPSAVSASAAASSSSAAAAAGAAASHAGPGAAHGDAADGSASGAGDAAGSSHGAAPGASGAGGKGKRGGKGKGGAAAGAGAAAAAHESEGERCNAGGSGHGGAGASVGAGASGMVGVLHAPVIRVSFPNTDVSSPAEAAARALAEVGLVGPAAHNSLWARIERDVFRHFGYRLTLWRNGGFPVPTSGAAAAALAPEATLADTHAPTSSARFYRCHRLPLLRRLCQKTGVQLIARSYTFPAGPTASASTSAPTPAASTSGPAGAAASGLSGGKGAGGAGGRAGKGSGAAADSAAAASASSSPASSAAWPASPFPASSVFLSADVAGLAPVVKSCMPTELLPEAGQLLARAQAAVSTSPTAAFDLVQEAMLAFYSVCGAGHRDVAECCATAAMVLSAAGEVVAAVQQQQRAVVLFERVLGPDHIATAYAHRKLGTYLSQAGLPNAALRHTVRHLNIMQLACPPSHPSVAACYADAALIYQAHEALPQAILCFQEAARHKYDSMQAIHYLEALALAYAASGNLRDAVTLQARIWGFYRGKVGEGHALTQEARHILEAFARGQTELAAANQRRVAFVRELMAQQAQAQAQAQAAAASSSAAGGAGSAPAGKKGGKK